MNTHPNTTIPSLLTAAQRRLRVLGSRKLLLASLALSGGILAKLALSLSRPLIKRLCGIFLGAALGYALSTQAQLLPGGAANEPDYVPGELIIKFKATATDGQLLDAWRGAGLGLIKSIKFKDPNHPGITHASTHLDVLQAVRILDRHPAIEYAEPNYKLYPAAVPNDPLFPDLWGLHNPGGHRSLADADIDAPEAWDITTGSSGVIIGIVDTGMDISHPDLAANIWTNPGEIPNDGIDNDGNGYVDDVNGWDFWNGDNTVYDPADGDTHGTHVAGIAGASGNNGIGVVGVNWNAKIMPLKFIGPEFGGFAAAAEAVKYAAEKGVKVLNGSFGRYSTGPGDVGQGLKDVLQASGILFVAAAGNDKINIDTTPFFPASYDLDLVIAVAATDKQDKLASFSNYGATSVDLGAPGVGIWSTRPGNAYTVGSGTSFAAPYVSGVAGLIYARFPNLTPFQVKDRILSGVNPVSALAGKTLTGGRLNAANALVSLDSPPSVAITSPLDGAVVAGTITLAASASDDQAITQVSFYLDGVTLLASDANAPYEVNWDSTSVAEGTHTITALATDTANQTASHTVSVVVDNLNDPPVPNAGADQTITDSDNSGSETVTLNGSASADPDGSIVAYEWKEGATVLGTGVSINPNLAVGSHTITLTVTDNEGASASDTVQIIVNAPPPPPANPLHSGDLDRSSANNGKNWWRATVVVTVHDGNDTPVPNATVFIQWGGGASGTANLATDANGRCTFISGNISKASSSATLSITGVTHAPLTYSAAANHDPDGDSNGTSITVNKP